MKYIATIRCSEPEFNIKTECCIKLLVIFPHSLWVLKRLSHEIFCPIFLPLWINLGLNVNRFCFFRYSNVSSILDNYLKFWCVSGQTFSEIPRISDKDWQLTPRFFKKVFMYYKLLWDTLMLLNNILGDQRTWLPVLLRGPRTQLSILLGNSMNLREGFTPKQRFLENL